MDFDINQRKELALLRRMEAEADQEETRAKMLREDWNASHRISKIVPGEQSVSNAQIALNENVALIADLQAQINVLEAMFGVLNEQVNG